MYQNQKNIVLNQALYRVKKMLSLMSFRNN